jgi:hypothetical protein
LHQPPWSFGFDSQTRGTRENRRTLYSSTGFLTGPTPPHAHSFVLGPAVINTHTHLRTRVGGSESRFNGASIKTLGFGTKYRWGGAAEWGAQKVRNKAFQDRLHHHGMTASRACRYRQCATATWDRGFRCSVRTRTAPCRLITVMTKMARAIRTLRPILTCRRSISRPSSRNST